MTLLLRAIYRLLRTIYRRLCFCLELSFRCAFVIYFFLAYVLVEKPMRVLQIGYRVHAGMPQPTGLWCIFAVAQAGRVSRNLIAILGCLKTAGYNVVLVNNGTLSPELVRSLLSHCHSVIERPRGGRDFGGYKWATNSVVGALGKNDEITQVIYCNDSIFVRPSHFKLLLDRIKQINEDYIGITDSFDPIYHVQSWFFVTSGRLFLSSEFQQFWE